MASLSCPLCHQQTEMRDFIGPPYRFGLQDVATAIQVDHPAWNRAEGLCETCANIYRDKLRQRQRIAEDILDAIEHLPDLEKRAFVFYHYRGLTIQDIAAREKIAEQYAREVLAHAARALYQKLHSRIPKARGLYRRVTR